MTTYDQKTMDVLRKMQDGEMTEHYVYSALANRLKEGDPNKAILQRIANEEKGHSNLWKRHTKTEAKVDHLRIAWFKALSRIFGFTFTLKLMEKGEDQANDVYQEIAKTFPEATRVAEDEQAHEKDLLGMLDEERLRYVGSMVLGLNDALVELTGTLAGLSFALQNTKIIALSGLITGISATLSMMSSEYLSARSEGAQHPLKAASYTGIMYIAAVVMLVLPYLIFPANQYLYALLSMLVIVILIIFIFTYYVSVAQDLPFKKRFVEMAAISLTVATIAFIIGIIVKQFLGIEV